MLQLQLIGEVVFPEKRAKDLVGALPRDQSGSYRTSEPAVKTYERITLADHLCTYYQIYLTYLLEVSAAAVGCEAVVVLDGRHRVQLRRDAQCQACPELV